MIVGILVAYNGVEEKPPGKPLPRGATAIQQDENLFVRLSFVFLA